MNTLTLILAIGALVVLVWAGIVLARGSLVGTALAVLLVGSCFGHSFLHVDVGSLPLAADHLLLVVLVAQYAIYRRWGQIEPRPPLATDYVLGAFLVVLVVSTLVHDYRADHFQPLAFLACFYLMPAVIYWMVRQSEWTAQTAWWVFAALAAFGVYLCATVAAETYGAWDFVFPKYIASPAFAEFYGRGRGPFLNPAATGLVQTLGMCAALAFWPRASRPGKLLLLALLGVFLCGIYSTLSRSVWLGAGGALLLMLALSTPRAWRFRVVATTVAGAAIAVGVSWQQYRAFEGDKGISAKAAAESTALRPILQVAWQMFLDRPILGCGLGQYSRELPAYLAQQTAQLPLGKSRAYAQDNVFLSLLTETGVLGTSLFVALLACWTLTAWRLRRAATAPVWARQMGLVFLTFMTAYLTIGMVCDLSKVPMVNMFLFFLGGAIMGTAVWLADPQAASLKLWRPREEPELVAN
ncbi:MAG: O-antigen ligase family protein [Pirellulales bacterium]